MSSDSTHDSLTADMLEVAGNMAALLGRSFGRQGAGLAVKTITQLAADAIRNRGVTTDQLVESLKHMSPLQMPWETKP